MSIQAKTFPFLFLIDYYYYYFCAMFALFACRIVYIIRNSILFQANAIEVYS